MSGSHFSDCHRLLDEHADQLFAMTNPGRFATFSIAVLRRISAVAGAWLVIHDGSSVPACTAAMYLAYQSGQFASRWPVRFSCSPWAASARRSAFARSFTDAKV